MDDQQMTSTPSLTDLVAQGCLSDLARQFLDATLATGRNVLIAGSPYVARPLIASLTQAGRAPALWAPRSGTVPVDLPGLSTAQELLDGAFDRVGGWLLTPAQAVEVLETNSGVVVAIDASRLDRALMRFELAASRHSASPGSGTLQVLAAVDVVVVLARPPTLKVQQIAEVVLVNEGYRPQILFSTGLPPMPQALVPLATPSFARDLVTNGYADFVEELRHAAPAATHDDAPTRHYVPAQQVAPSRSAAAVPHNVVRPVSSVPVNGPAPGWELDEGSDTESSEPLHEQSAEEATIAATYGLGPPPRPAGVLADSSFEEILRKKRLEDKPDHES